jgi:hypothetical protein
MISEMALIFARLNSLPPQQQETVEPRAEFKALMTRFYEARSPTSGLP